MNLVWFREVKKEPDFQLTYTSGLLLHACYIPPAPSRSLGAPALSCDCVAPHSLPGTHRGKDIVITGKSPGRGQRLPHWSGSAWTDSESHLSQQAQKGRVSLKPFLENKEAHSHRTTHHRSLFPRHTGHLPLRTQELKVPLIHRVLVFFLWKQGPGW